MKKIIIAVVSLAALLALAWAVWPTLVVGSIAFVEAKGEEPSRRACDRIVAVGPRAIPAIIRSLKANSPWTRRYCYLPIALRELGEPARAALVTAIDSESDSLARARLISALQSGFADYSRLTILIEDVQAERLGRHAAHSIGWQLRGEFTNAPPFLLEDKGGTGSALNLILNRLAN